MKKILRYILITLFCCVIFFLFGEPCRYFLKLSETTEVRPVAAFPLLFGIAYGFFGTFGCALGNMLADIISGYPSSIFILGFFIQLAYGYIPFLCIASVIKQWKKNKINSKKSIISFSLNGNDFYEDIKNK